MEKTPLISNPADIIFDYKEREGLTYKEIADKIGISRWMIYRAATNGTVTEEAAKLIGGLLNIDVSLFRIHISKKCKNQDKDLCEYAEWWNIQHPIVQEETERCRAAYRLMVGINGLRKGKRIMVFRRKNEKHADD